MKRFKGPWSEETRRKLELLAENFTMKTAIEKSERKLDKLIHDLITEVADIAWEEAEEKFTREEIDKLESMFPMGFRTMTVTKTVKSPKRGESFEALYGKDSTQRKGKAKRGESFREVE